ncbi:MAG: ATP-binding protein [Tannerellaceae bacterium]|nr:ATP-binding protein [Tannerellaceae bacterium]
MMKKLHLKNDMNELHRLHDFMDQVSGELGLSPHTSMNLKLALEEALVNVICYAYPEEKDQIISLYLEALPEQLTFTLVDSGTPFNPIAKPEPDIELPEKQRPIGGLGIFLVKKLMTKVIYERSDNKNILTLIKELP